MQMDFPVSLSTLIFPTDGPPKHLDVCPPCRRVLLDATATMLAGQMSAIRLKVRRLKETAEIAQ